MQNLISVHCGICLLSIQSCLLMSLITQWEKLLDSGWLRDCECIRNLRANSVVRGKLQISRAKSVIRSECKHKKEITIKQLMINDQ